MFYLEFFYAFCHFYLVPWSFPQPFHFIGLNTLLMVPEILRVLNAFCGFPIFIGFLLTYSATASNPSLFSSHSFCLCKHCAFCLPLLCFPVGVQWISCFHHYVLPFFLYVHPTATFYFLCFSQCFVLHPFSSVYII